MLKPRPAAVINLCEALLLIAPGRLFPITVLAVLALLFLLGENRSCADDPADDLGKPIRHLLVFGLNPLRLSSAAQVSGDRDAKEAGGMEPRLVVIGIGSPLSIISPRELERLHHLLDNRACDLVSADPEYHLAGDRYILDRAVGVFDSAEDRAGDPEPIEVPYRQVVKQRPCPRPGIASLPPVFLFTLLLLAPVFGNPPLIFG